MNEVFLIGKIIYLDRANCRYNMWVGQILEKLKNESINNISNIF